MSKSTKIVIDVVVVVAIVIWVGYLILSSKSNDDHLRTYQNTSQQGGPSFLNQMNRTLHESGVLPGGDGGGG